MKLPYTWNFYTLFIKQAKGLKEKHYLFHKRERAANRTQTHQFYYIKKNECKHTKVSEISYRCFINTNCFVSYSSKIFTRVAPSTNQMGKK